MATLNLGILAHVDAGKTTLTERLLHAAGVIDEVGRVDDGTTQTDSLALERQRGITIKSAVVSFVVDGVTINLIDTPGHPDFIAEVERVLGVLDGAVLVVSAVEGVQSQTLLLFRALRRLGVPTIVFVNKIDRVGADDRRVLAAVAERLAANVLAMGTPSGVGTRRAGVDGARPRRSDVRRGGHRAAGRQRRHDPAPLRRRGADRSRPTRRGARRPDGAAARRCPCTSAPRSPASASTTSCTRIPTLLPAVDGDRTGPASGTVFKIERATERREDRVRAHVLRDAPDAGSRPARRPAVETVTAIDVFERGTTQRRPATRTRARSPRSAGSRRPASATRSARRPTSATGTPSPHPRWRPRSSRGTDGQKRAVFDALTELAEQDPLIDLRQDDTRHELFLSLYGEVQKEIVAQTLAGGLRPRHRVPTDDAGLHRAAQRRRRGRRTDPTRPVGRATRSWPRSAWRSRRCRPARA